MSAVLEAAMLVCFGLSWPINALKAWKSRTAVGTSWTFLALITFGYLAGIAAEFTKHHRSLARLHIGLPEVHMVAVHIALVLPKPA